jgi:hypothetical protein
MSLVELPEFPLPREPPKYEEWKKDWPQYLGAYNLAFNAERDATENDDIISARVAGYLLVELFNWSNILTMCPCDQLSNELQSKSQEPGGSVNDVVFKIGKMYRDRFIRLCAFLFFLHTSFNLSISLQLGRQPRRTPPPHCTLPVLPSTHWKKTPGLV